MSAYSLISNVSPYISQSLVQQRHTQPSDSSTWTLNRQASVDSFAHTTTRPIYFGDRRNPSYGAIAAVAAAVIIGPPLVYATLRNAVDPPPPSAVEQVEIAQRPMVRYPGSGQDNHTTHNSADLDDRYKQAPWLVCAFLSDGSYEIYAAAAEPTALPSGGGLSFEEFNPPAMNQSRALVPDGSRIVQVLPISNGPGSRAWDDTFNQGCGYLPGAIPVDGGAIPDGDDGGDILD